MPGSLRGCKSNPMRILPALFCPLALPPALSACGSDTPTTDMEAGATIVAGGNSRLTLGVNSYLWHASLDTLSFMPLQSADPFGGVIITDWYASPSAPNERMRVTVYILDRRLRADGLKVAVFRQSRSGEGWADAQVSPETANKLEDAILARARELRLASGGT